MSWSGTANKGPDSTADKVRTTKGGDYSPPNPIAKQETFKPSGHQHQHIIPVETWEENVTQAKTGNLLFVKKTVKVLRCPCGSEIDR